MSLFSKLIDQVESEWLDFKQEFHSQKSELIYDIVCLLNSECESDRYLVFGVADNDKSIHDVSLDAYRKTSAQIIDLLRGAKINRMPLLSITSEVVEGKTVDILILKNTRHKPYYLLEDYRDGNFTFTGGRIPTRYGDTNSPRNKCADEHLIENMFKERFGIQLTPLERMRIYLMDIPNWIKEYNEKDELFFYYSLFPEFILIRDKKSQDDYEIDWTYNFLHSECKSEYFYLKYHSTILAKIVLIWCDDSRYLTVAPDSRIRWDDENYSRVFYFVKGDLKYLVNEMIQALYPISSKHYIEGKILLVEEESQVDEYLERSAKFQEGPSYFFDAQTKKRYIWQAGSRHELMTLLKRKK